MLSLALGDLLVNEFVLQVKFVMALAFDVAAAAGLICFDSRPSGIRWGLGKRRVSYDLFAAGVGYARGNSDLPDTYFLVNSKVKYLCKLQVKMICGM